VRAKNIFASFVIFLLLFQTMIYAVPGTPSSIAGKINDGTAPLGLLIQAKINDVVYAESYSVLVSGYTYYVLEVPADDPDTPLKDGGIPGDLVEIFVADRKASQTVFWQSGGIQQDITVDLDGLDQDDDGIADSADNCPQLSNSDQRDWDLDMIGDVCDPDDDNDTINDTDDNCPFVQNTLQDNFDQDEFGDVCDPDDDNDDVLDENDSCSETPLDQISDESGCSCSQKTCVDGNICTYDSCDILTGECLFTNADYGTICGGSENVESCESSELGSSILLMEIRDVCDGLGNCVEEETDWEPISTCPDNALCEEQGNTATCVIVDTDSDGVFDTEDYCPLTQENEVVDSRGCSCAQKSCDTGNSCAEEFCSLETALCVSNPVEDGTSCGADSSWYSCSDNEPGSSILFEEVTKECLSGKCEIVVTGSSVVQQCSSDEYCDGPSRSGDQGNFFCALESEEEDEEEDDEQESEQGQLPLVEFKPRESDSPAPSSRDIRVGEIYAPDVMANSDFIEFYVNVGNTIDYYTEFTVSVFIPELNIYQTEKVEINGDDNGAVHLFISKPLNIPTGEYMAKITVSAYGIKRSKHVYFFVE
jgi:hypothetical protein